MLWNFIIIGAVVIIFIILARRIPLAKELNKKNSRGLSDDEMTTVGKISQADDYFDQKKFSEAEALYIKIAASEPNNSKVYTRLGAIYLEQKNYYDAKEAFLVAIKIDPDNGSRYVNLGLAYMGLKDYFKAENAFKDALKLDKKNKKYQKLLERAEKLLEKEKKIK